MKTVIYYFSATGNSLHVAKMIAAELEDAKLVSIPCALKSKQFIPEAESVGFVFPLHCFSLPMMVEDFIRQVDLQSVKYIFAVVTCGMPNLGCCFHELSRLLGAKDKILNASWFVKMLSIYIKLSDLPPEKKRLALLEKADKKIPEIIRVIKRREHAATSEFFAWPARVIHKNWRKKQALLAADFSVDTSACTGCGLCEQVCPADNISLIDGEPVWHDKCTECLGCLHICPKRVIECGSKTKNRARYRHPDITVAELINEKKIDE